MSFGIRDRIRPTAFSVMPGTRTAAAAANGEVSASDRQRAMSWAQRLKRVFAIDIETCQQCSGRLRVIASIEEPAVIERILEHLGHTAEPGSARWRPRSAVIGPVSARSNGLAPDIMAPYTYYPPTAYLYITNKIGNITTIIGYMVCEMTPALEAVFGNRTAASVLLFLENYDSGHASRIAKAYEIPLYAVQKQLQKLEAAGVLVSRKVGRTRVFEFNPRNPMTERLRQFLAAELRALPEDITAEYFRERQRPRRSGKPLERASE